MNCDQILTELYDYSTEPWLKNDKPVIKMDELEPNTAVASNNFMEIKSHYLTLRDIMIYLRGFAKNSYPYIDFYCFKRFIQQDLGIGTNMITDDQIHTCMDEAI